MNDPKPSVSVVTPAYNQGAFIRDTIDSVLAQDYPNLDYVVIDDGSTDDTQRTLKTYGNRIKWHTQSNQGQTRAINTGWSAARGEILSWLNSDDTLLPGAVLTAVRYLRRHPDVGVVFGDTLYTDAAGQPLRRSVGQGPFDYKEFVLECENPIPQPSAFVRRTVLQSIGLLDPRYQYFMDWDYWLRAGLQHRIDYIPELLSTYRLHPQSKTVARTGELAQELEYMYAKLFRAEAVPAWLRQARRRATMNMYFTMAGYLMRAGDHKGAAATTMKALRQRPSGLLAAASLRKALYCVAGDTRAYAAARRFFRRGEA